VSIPPDNLPCAVILPPLVFVVGCAFMPPLAALMFALAVMCRSAPHTLARMIRRAHEYAKGYRSDT
jgi:hypothetical protein